MTDTNKLKELLLELPQINFAKHIKSVESAITMQWGAVPWNEKQICIDILQNYRDSQVEANKDISDIKIIVDGDQIRVFAPTIYNLEKLYYVGSEKSNNPQLCGENGEGIKKAWADLARLGIFNPISLSGKMALIVSIGKEVTGSSLRPLIYNYYSINDVKGSYSIINTISKKLKDEFKVGMQNFFYDKNPLVGDCLHSHGGISIFKSNNKEGICFYKGLARLKPGLPLVINIDRPYAALEKKTRMDRDRKEFNEKLRSTYFSIFARSGFYYKDMKNNPAIKYILLSAKYLWSKGSGHPLLAAIASCSYGILKDDQSIKELFAKGYFAESRWHYSRNISYSDWFSTKTQNYIRTHTANQKKKKQILPSYFTEFGLISSLENFIRNKANTEKRIANKKTKELTPKEQKAIDFCFEAAKGVSPAFAKLFNNTEDEEESLYKLNFKKIFCKELLGQIKNNSDYNSKTVYLHADLFKQSFGKMFSTFLHELSHTTGNGDGSREFSDCLTFLISACIDNNAVVRKYTKQWSSIMVN